MAQKTASIANTDRNRPGFFRMNAFSKKPSKGKANNRDEHKEIEESIGYPKGI
jgi:hypothetical protein